MSDIQVVNATGPDKIMNFVVTCQYSDQINFYGLRHHNPLKYSPPIQLLQMVLIFLTTRAAYVLLRPLHQTTIIAQIIVSSLYALISKH